MSTPSRWGCSGRCDNRILSSEFPAMVFLEKESVGVVSRGGKDVFVVEICLTIRKLCWQRLATVNLTKCRRKVDR